MELLEQAVLNRDVEEVKKILKEQVPIEFTAKAIGLSCRFVGAQMVDTLLDGGATLKYELTLALKFLLQKSLTICLSHADYLTVLDPQDLREDVKKWLKEIMRKYE